MPYKFVEKWYYIADKLPDDMESVYVRLANNDYNPIRTIYNQSFKYFICTTGLWNIANEKVLQWARLYPPL